MKKVISIFLIIIMVLCILNGILFPIAGENNDNAANKEPTQSTRGSPRWNSYKAYYNKTFSIDKEWEVDNVSVVVFVQTNDQVNKSASGSSYKFNSGEVLQSVVNDLNGKSISTGTSRRVLAELFTSEYCGYCPGAVGAMDRIARDSNYYPSKMSLIEWHPNSGSFADSYGFPGSDARINWYFSGHSFGYPASIFDGVIEQVGGNQDGNSTAMDTSYKNHINSRTPKASIIDIKTIGNKDSNSGWINVSVELLNPTPIRNLKVNFVVVEDVYPAMKGSAYLRYTARSVITQEDFTPPNHSPTIKNTLPDLEIYEDDYDSTTIKLGGAFEDEDLDVLTFSSDRDGGLKQHIEVVIDENGNVTLTPDDNWNGAEDITFYADDSIAEPTTQTITVTVSNVNDPPTLEHPMVDFTMFEDIKLENKFNLSYHFDDIDMDPALNAIPQPPLKFTYSGNKNIEVEIVNSWVSFDPKPDWNGNETITFNAEDSLGLKVSDNVKIWVRSGNDVPVLQTQFPVAIMDEDNNLEDFIDLNDYFFDRDGDVLTYSVIKPKNLDVRLSYKSESVFVSIYPERNYWGTDEVIIQATDIPGSDPVNGTIQVTVNSVNDPPIFNETDDWDIVSSSVYISDITIKVFEDIAVTLYATAYDPADHDTITFSDNTELFEIDPNSGEISFNPTNDDVGEYDVTISVDDGQAVNNIVSNDFKFIVENVNDPPNTPIIKSPKDRNTYITDSPIKFKGIGDDPDLHIPDTKDWISYEWTTNASKDELSLDKEFSKKLEPGFYQIILTVSDSSGEKVSTEISIRVDINRTLDTDKDGTPDYQDDDDDGDQIPDEWELKYPNILNPLDPLDAKEDNDKDGYSNLEEYLGDDGKPGNADSTNPERKSDAPDRGATADGGGGEDSSSSYYIFAAVLVIVVIIILILLFMFMRSKKKKDEEEEKPVSMPPPQPQAGPQVDEGMTMPSAPQMPLMPPIPPMEQMSPEMMQRQMQQLQYYPYPPVDQPQPPQQSPTQHPQQIGAQQPGFPTTMPGQTTTPASCLPQNAQPQPLLEPTKESANQTGTITTQQQQPAPALDTTSQRACPNCNQPINVGWLVCPNCKNVL